MHFFCKHRVEVFFTLIFICVVPNQSIPTESPCDVQRENCSLSSNLLPNPSTSSSRPRTTSKTNPYEDFDSFSENLKRAAIILAAIALLLGILRVCLMFCKSNHATRRQSTVSPFRSRNETSVVKQDLPPAYAEAFAHPVVDGGKLPSYDELPADHHQPPYTVERDYATTVTPF